MSNIYGVSAFGLKDCTTLPERGCTAEDFFLADAVLPKSPLGVILTGKEAEGERVHSGLTWPKEARVEPGKPLRRVPIPVAWSLLVDAGDKPVRWQAGQGVSIPVASILAAHVKGALRESGFQFEKKDHAVVAIPDHLDEYGQEALLQAFGNTEERFSLLWRPVAAAMAWLDGVRIEEVAIGDWMLIIYLGPDAIEFTPFGLDIREHEGQPYVLPVRNRPRHAPGPPGFEWVCALAEKTDLLCAEDPGAFWQAFTNFPELWAAVSQTPWDMAELPRAWSMKDGWKHWNPSPALRDAVWDCPVGESQMLKKLVRGSCCLETNRRGSSAPTWDRHLEAELAAAVNDRNGRLRGVVLCGPLASLGKPPWLTLKNASLRFETEPHPDTVWLAAACEDPVATGSRLFGERLDAGQPTYLDTLPGLALLRQKGGKLDWVDIVEAEECPGGNEYGNKIEGRFYLPGGSDKMEVYLRKEKREENSDRQVPQGTQLRDEFIDPIKRRVEALGSLENVEQSDAWDANATVRSYALSYAHWFYWKRNLSNSPFRHGEVVFPSIPKKNVPLTVMVKMRPASGLAKVDFIPESEEPLMRRAVSFDYSRMNPIGEDELPELSLGWPEDLHIEVSSDPSAFNDYLNRFDKFLRQHNTLGEYITNLDAMKVALCSQVMEWRDGGEHYLKKIDENGKAGSPTGQRMVTRIKQRVEEGAYLFLHRTPPSLQARTFIVRSTWLWGGTPEVVCKYLEDYFTMHRGDRYDVTWNYFVESASRCFTTNQRYEILFKAIHKRLIYSQGNNLPINAIRSTSKVLAYRIDGWSGLNEHIAFNFVHLAASVVSREVYQKKNIKQSFFQAAFLFLSLLKYRNNNLGFMNPDGVKCRAVFSNIEKSLRDAILVVKNDPSRATISIEKIDKLITGVIDFMYFKGKSGLISEIEKMSEKGD
jgi:hypothetical protein